MNNAEQTAEKFLSGPCREAIEFSEDQEVTPQNLTYINLHIR